MYFAFQIGIVCKVQKTDEYNKELVVDVRFIISC